MTYYGVVLLMSGYQADEKNILKQYKIFVDKCAETYVSMTAVFFNILHDFAGSKGNTPLGHFGS